MGTSISSLFPNAPSTAAKTSPNDAPTQPARPATKAPSDTVELSQAQQVYQLFNQGQRVSQIASSLSLSVEAVNNYLNISNG